MKSDIERKVVTKDGCKVLLFRDFKNEIAESFNMKTGAYIRVKVENGKINLKGDSFMRSMPNLLDIGIMQTCVCSHRCNVDCYQKAIDRKGANMSVDNFRKIMEQTKGTLSQVALGGAGDVDAHENFEEILQICHEYDVVPNFTTSGIMMTSEKAEICKKYCGAVAVSWHDVDYTMKAIGTLLAAEVKTSIHYVLSKKSIAYATEMIRTNGFPKGINAVVFLMYKPVGLGKEENVLQPEDVKDFFDAVDNCETDFKIGFDSCSCAGIINNTKNVIRDSLDFCEGGRYSAYIDANMNMMPCSFANQDSRWFVSLNNHTVEEAWHSAKFELFRNSLRNSCPSCADRESCGGGCPLVNQITLCNSDCRKFEKPKIGDDEYEISK